MAEPTDPKNAASKPPSDESTLDSVKKAITANQKELTLNAQALKNATLNAADLTKELNKQNEIYKKQGEFVQNVSEYSKDLVDSEQILEETKENQLKLLKDEFLTNQKTIILLLEKRKLLDEEVKNKQKTKEQAEAEKKDIEDRLKALKKQTFDQGNLIEQGEKEKKIKQDIKSIGKEILQDAFQQTIALEAHIMNISKLNGGYAEYGSKLREANLQVYQATSGTGIMLEEANAAFAGLSQNFIALTTQSQGSIAKMVEGAAQLTKLGVDAGSAAKGFDSLVNAMGKTPQQAYKIQESFVQMAAKNRLALGAVSQAFAENSGRFVGYGEQMTKVLDGLAEQSLKTGIAIGKLVGIAQQFDTFKGASDAVGNLNALLGGDYFNSIELLTASDEERIKLLKEGVAASGMQWESMNRFQKMAIANAAGITDLNEASKLFGKTSLENTKQQAEAAAVQKTLAEQAESVSTSMDKMKSVLNGIIIALDPFVSIFSTIVEIILLPTKLGKGVEGFGGKILTFFGSLASLALTLALKNLILTRSFGGLGSVIAGATKKLWAWIAGKKAADSASTLSAVQGPATAAAAPTGPAGGGAFSNAGNMIKAAAGMLIFAAAMFVMAKALQEFTIAAQNDKTGGGLGYAAAALIGLSVAALILSKSGSEVIKGSAIVLVMAASLLLLGIAVKSFSKIDWPVLGIIAAVLIGLSVALVLLGLAVSGPQALLFLAGIGVILAMSVALLALGGALTVVSAAISIGSSAISRLVDSFKQLFEIKNLKDNFSSVESFLSQLSNIDYEPINQLANAIGLLAENLQKLASVSANMNIKGNVETTTTQNIQTLANQAGQSAASIGQTASARTQQSLIPAQQTTNLVPLIVQVNGKNIIDVLREDIKIISNELITREINSLGLTTPAYSIQASQVTKVG